MDSNDMMQGMSEGNEIAKVRLVGYFRCSHAGCMNFPLFAQAYTGADAGVFEKNVCKDHVVIGQEAKYLDIQYVRTGFNTVTTKDAAFFASPAIVDRAIEERLPMMVSFAKVAIDLMDAKREAVIALDNFKEKVVEAVVDWDGGCQSGKEEFLQEIGLEWPMQAVTLTITFEYRGKAEDIDTSSIEYAVGCALDYDYDAMDCEVDY